MQSNKLKKAPRIARLYLQILHSGQEMYKMYIVTAQNRYNATEMISGIDEQYCN